jgi:hypothetical protein
MFGYWVIGIYLMMGAWNLVINPTYIKKGDDLKKSSPFLFCKKMGFIYDRKRRRVTFATR